LPSEPQQTYLWYNAAAAYWTPLLGGTNYFDFLPACVLVIGLIAGGLWGFKALPRFAATVILASVAISFVLSILPNWSWLSTAGGQSDNLQKLALFFGTQTLLYQASGCLGFAWAAMSRTIIAKPELRRHFIFILSFNLILLCATMAVAVWDAAVDRHPDWRDPTIGLYWSELFLHKWWIPVLGSLILTVLMAWLGQFQKNDLDR